MSLNQIWKSLNWHLSILNLRSLVSFALLASGSALSLNLTLTTQHAVAQLNQSQVPLAEGTYLYGSSSEPEVIGQEYLVFQVRQNQVVGASYFPLSEFACFQGNISNQAMNLTLTVPYSGEKISYPIALVAQSPIAGSDNPPNLTVGLEGYEKLSAISDNDWRILNTCLNVN